MLRRNLNTRSSCRPLLAVAAWVLTMASCSFSKPDIATVPAHPTFEVDVQPLLADHCVLCHGYPAKRGAPSNFRLDVYTTTDGVRAALQEADRFIRSIDDGKMPPSAKWGDGMGPNGKALLHNWQADGYPP